MRSIGWWVWTALALAVLSAGPAGAMRVIDTKSQQTQTAPMFRLADIEQAISAKLSNGRSGSEWLRLLSERHARLCGRGAVAPGGLVMRWTLASRIYAWQVQLASETRVFLLSELLLAASFFVTAFVLGLLVEWRRWNANYTRKALGIVLLAAPILIGSFVPYVANPLTIVVSYVLMLIYLCFLADPFRRRSRFLDIAFKSLDRPEDRPHTLMWLISGYVASSVILLTMMWWAVPNQPELVFVAFLGVAIGDLLAGAVGHRYGEHRYTTTALFTAKTFTRSWEGSACVFATTFIAVLLVGSALPLGQFVAALILMPMVLTVAEAKSPHTWDEPVMFLAAMITAMAIVKFWQLQNCSGIHL